MDDRVESRAFLYGSSRPAGGPDPGARPVSRRIGLLAFGYCASGALGLLLAVPPGYATAVWPPSGIALAGLLAWGPRVWPGICIGSFLVNAWIAYHVPGVPFGLQSLAVAASIGVGSTLQALLAAFLLRRWIGAERLFESAPATFAFITIVATCFALAPSWGVATITLAGLIEPGALVESWRTWWVGDVMGALVFVPMLLNWRQLLPHQGRAWKVTEYLGEMALLTTVTAIVFLRPSSPGDPATPLGFLPLALLVWLACRTNAAGVALATCIVCTIAIVASSAGRGPFAGDPGGAPLLLLQTFTALTTITALLLAAAVTRYRLSTASLRRLSAELEQLALTDELTSLYNRRGFLLLAEQAWRFARRSYARSVLMFMDVDGLKRVNDALGHRVGDELLVNAGRVIASVFRETDVMARVGGDEFAVLALMDGEDGPDAGRNRLQARIDEFNELRARPYRLSMSIGVEILPEKAEAPLEELLARADQAMYARKRQRDAPPSVRDPPAHYPLARSR